MEYLRFTWTQFGQPTLVLHSQATKSSRAACRSSENIGRACIVHKKANHHFITHKKNKK